MPNSFENEARTSQGSKMSAMIGKRGEYAPDRAERILGAKVNAAAAEKNFKPEENWIGAPARQVSDLGNVRK